MDVKYVTWCLDKSMISKCKLLLLLSPPLFHMLYIFKSQWSSKQNMVE